MKDNDYHIKNITNLINANDAKGLAYYLDQFKGSYGALYLMTAIFAPAKFTSMIETSYWVMIEVLKLLRNEKGSESNDSHE